MDHRESVDSYTSYSTTSSASSYSDETKKKGKDQGIVGVYEVSTDSLASTQTKKSASSEEAGHGQKRNAIITAILTTSSVPATKLQLICRLLGVAMGGIIAVVLASGVYLVDPSDQFVSYWEVPFNYTTDANSSTSDSSDTATVDQFLSNITKITLGFKGFCLYTLTNSTSVCDTDDVTFIDFFDSFPTYYAYASNITFNLCATLVFGIFPYVVIPLLLRRWDWNINFLKPLHVIPISIVWFAISIITPICAQLRARDALEAITSSTYSPYGDDIDKAHKVSGTALVIHLMCAILLTIGGILWAIGFTIIDPELRRHHSDCDDDDDIIITTTATNTTTNDNNSDKRDSREEFGSIFSAMPTMTAGLSRNATVKSNNKKMSMIDSITEIYSRRTPSPQPPPYSSTADEEKEKVEEQDEEQDEKGKGKKGREEDGEDHQTLSVPIPNERKVERKGSQHSWRSWTSHASHRKAKSKDVYESNTNDEEKMDTDDDKESIYESNLDRQDSLAEYYYRMKAARRGEY